jgi:hypothetical protein
VLETQRAGTIHNPCRELALAEAIDLSSDCGMNGEVTLDPQSLNSLVNENGITLAGCEWRALLKVVLCDMEGRKYEYIVA